MDQYPRKQSHHGRRMGIFYRRPGIRKARLASRKPSWLLVTVGDRWRPSPVAPATAALFTFGMVVPSLPTDSRRCHLSSY